MSALKRYCMRSQNHKLILAISLMVTGPSFGVHLVTEGPTLGPERIHIVRKEGLRIYKDPYTWDWQDAETDPVLTTLKGEVTIERLGPPMNLHSFRYLTRLYEKKLYEMVTPKAARTNKGDKSHLPGPTRIVFVRILDSGYADTLGFVVESEFRAAQVEEHRKNRLPPSVKQIPDLTMSRE